MSNDNQPLSLAAHDIQYMDVKMMSEILERTRSRVRADLKRARLTRDVFRAERDDVLSFYARVDAEMASSRLSASYDHWYRVHRDYHAMVRRYLNNLRRTAAYIPPSGAGGYPERKVATA